MIKWASIIDARHLNLSATVYQKLQRKTLILDYLIHLYKKDLT